MYTSGNEISTQMNIFFSFFKFGPTFQIPLMSLTYISVTLSYFDIVFPEICLHKFFGKIVSTQHFKQIVVFMYGVKSVL